MTELPVGSRILATLRTIADLKQGEVETNAHYPEGSVTNYERRKEPPPDVLADLVHGGMGIPAYLLPRTRDLIEEVDAARDPARAPDPDEVARRELEERSYAVFRDLVDRIDAFVEARLEHREAPYLWRRLDETHSPEERLAMVKVSRSLWSPGLCALVCEKSVSAAAHDGREAEELAHLAIEIARRVPGGEDRRARLEGLAQAALGNALRVRSQLPSADDAFALSARLWSQGAGTFQELLDPSRPLDLEASLRLSQRRLPDASQLLDRTIHLARSSRARGRILLLRAKILEEQGDSAAALACLEQAEPHVVEAGEPYHLFTLALTRLVNLVNLGRIGEAAQGLEDAKGLAKCLRGAPPLARCRWLEARIAAALGQKEDAIAAFREVLEVFIACESLYDCALIHLEMAVLLLATGRTGEVRKLVTQMEPIFVAQGVHREALAALRLFVEAVQEERASVEMARKVLDFLDRSRYNAEVHFEGWCTPFPRNQGQARERGNGMSPPNDTRRSDRASSRDRRTWPRCPLPRRHTRRSGRANSRTLLWCRPADRRNTRRLGRPYSRPLLWRLLADRRNSCHSGRRYNRSRPKGWPELPRVERRDPGAGTRETRPARFHRSWLPRARQAGEPGPTGGRS